MKLHRISVAALVASSLALLGVAGPASAAIPMDHFDVSTSTQQAGAHPDLVVDIETARETDVRAGNEVTSPIERPKSLQIDLPQGLVGNATAVPRCDPLDFLGAGCPYASQVGVVDVDTGIQALNYPVWLLPPGVPGETARLGLRPGYLFTSTVSIRPRSESDYGLRSTADHLPSYSGGIARITLTLWGDPASPSHDRERRNAFGGGACGDDPVDSTPLPCASPAAAIAQPFLTNPSTCGPLSEQPSLRIASWETPDQVTALTDRTPIPPTTNCAAEPFAPSIAVAADDRRPDTPSGYGVTVTVPQQSARTGLATSNVRTVDLTLPPGVAISPAGANGLQACTDEQLALGQDAPASCPGASSLGTATIDVPILPDPLEGRVYLRPPTPGHLFRLAIAADGPGLHLKVVGEATPDPVTGQLRAVFADAPQQPFSRLALHFDGGPQAALANPQACGTYTVVGSIDGWNGASVPVASGGSIDQDCALRGFAPSLSAGTTSTQAGGYTGFVLNVSRPDGQQNLGAIDAQLPAGVTAKINGVPLCAEANAAAGTCGPESLIGSATAGVGSGPAPVYLGGRAYLTEGYGGAPYGMAFVVPARIGPFDLGNVVVRARILVDRATAALRVLSDPLPTIIQGVPLRMRELRIAIDRPGFMINPTSCTGKAVAATLTAVEGAVATPSVPFAATGCRALPFAPVITATTNGRVAKNAGASLGVSIKQAAGQANLARVAVTLPVRIAARGTTIRTPCSNEDWLAGTCPAKNRVGSATATTPILGTPLEGGVYFVTRPKGQRGLPQLRTILTGSGLSIELTGDVAVGADGFTTTTFASVPDVPISAFAMDLQPGPNSLLDNVGSLCTGGALTMKTDATAQSGARAKGSVKLKVTGCKKAATRSRR